MVKVVTYHLTKSGNKSKKDFCTYLTLEEAKADIKECINKYQAAYTRGMGWVHPEVQVLNEGKKIVATFTPVIRLYAPATHVFEII